MEIKYDRLDVFLSAAMVLCGYCYWELGVCSEDQGAAVTLFTAMIVAITWTYLQMRGHRQSGRSLICVGIMGLLAASFMLFDGNCEHVFGFLTLQAVYVYWVAVTTGTRVEEGLSIYVIGDAIRQFFVIPLGNFFGCPASFISGPKNKKISRGVFAVIFGLIISVPLVFAVIYLLTTADSRFGVVMFHIFNIYDWNWTSYLLSFMLGLPVAFYLFGLVFGNVKGKNRDVLNKDSLAARAAKMKAMPAAITLTVMTVLNLIYTIFLVLQTSYLFSAFKNVLPDGMTYAEYARSGFFQLCLVAVINFAVVAAACSFSKSESIHSAMVLKVETAIMALFTIGLSATAFRKMYMYIDAYGLTRLRVYTSLFLLFMALTFAVIFARQLRRFNGTRIVVILALVMMLGFVYGNIDGHIARYNMARYEAGTMKLMDENSMASLSGGAVPYIYEAYSRTDNARDKASMHFVLTGERKVKDGIESLEYKKLTWENWNLQAAKADELRSRVK